MGTLWNGPESPGWAGTYDTGPGISLGFPRKAMGYQLESHGWVTGSANSVFLNNPYGRYQRRRVDPSGEITDWIRFALDPAIEVLRALEPGSEDRGDAAMRRPLGPRTSGVFQVQRLLHEHTSAASDPDPLFVEEAGLWILEQTYMAALDLDGPPRNDPTASAHRGIADAAATFLSRNFRRPLRAATLARAVHASRPTLFRAFQRHNGMTVHRYLTSLRLREAYLRLERDSVPLADLACELGFSSHSHLSAVFRKEFGVHPSRVADEHARLTRRQEIEATLRARHLPIPS
ncbi:MAG: AraC family transcriptional regulator [Candidatus Eisenbacteria bacterium]|uniref:Helix-turn-helix transcriptional regulator n=1 Tax=Eiseniibacteriota bacterium TaxID=2212470 RepID=A0A956LYN2_UNCEI|nr:helix-turn-helix transcriptional regulator [Candidatus Eisenbacteria bacterium]